jgi:hypothetical protein
MRYLTARAKKMVAGVNIFSSPGKHYSTLKKVMRTAFVLYALRDFKSLQVLFHYRLNDLSHQLLSFTSIIRSLHLQQGKDLVLHCRPLLHRNTIIDKMVYILQKLKASKSRIIWDSSLSNHDELV